MKPWSATLIGLALSSTAMAGHGPFTGVYGGFSAGGTQIETYHESSFGLGGSFASTISQSPKDTDVSGVLGISAGYNVRLEDFFIVGIEGRAHWEDINIEHGVALNVNSGSSTTVAASNVSVNLDNDLALLAKLGIMLDADFLFYGLIGIDWGQFTYNNQSTVTSGSLNVLLADSSNQYNSALLLGLGIEYMLSRVLSIGMEYSYVNYGQLDEIDTLMSPLGNAANFVNPNLIDARTNNAANFVNPNLIDARTNKVTLNFNYYFG